ncbi:hypothetical protein DER44DRAFT_788109 [Fusarium oxysporum]|nr:hypothetical protein DER44DRAFT_788109 [Fusarium oxysporum]
MSRLEWLLDVPLPVTLMWFLAIETSFQMPKDTAAKMMKRMIMMMAITSFFFMLTVMLCLVRLSLLQTMDSREMFQSETVSSRVQLDCRGSWVGIPSQELCCGRVELSRSPSQEVGAEST